MKKGGKIGEREGGKEGDIGSDGTEQEGEDVRLSGS